VFSPSISAEDSIEFIRPIIYLIFLFVPIFYVLDERRFGELIGFLLWISIIQILFSVAVFFPSLWPITDLYKGKLSDSIGDYSIEHFFRFSGTLGFPSFFAFYLLFYMLYVILILRFGRHSGYKKIALISFVFITTIGLLLTGSRAGIAAFLLMLMMVVVFLLDKKIIASIAIIVVLVSGLIYLSYEHIQELESFKYIQMLIDEGVEDDSAEHRIKEANLMFSLMIKYFPFGFGANKDFFSKTIGPVESSHGYYMGKYGFLGLSLYLGYYALLSYIALKVSRIYKENPEVKAFSYTYLIWSFVMVIIFGAVTSATEAFRGAFIFYTYSGYIFMFYLLKKKYEFFSYNTGQDIKR
jgi:hypothetical protein